LILAAANKPGYARLIDNAVKAAKEKGGSLEQQTSFAIDRLVCSTSPNILVSVTQREPV
jgi:transaldolase